MLRLRIATRTTAALACSLIVLFLLIKATRQPLTVALLGVVITMVASRSANEPEPRQQRITMGLLPVPASAAITAAAILAPHRVAAIQVAVAASLAIVAGETVSPARWYWAVVAAFVIFAGTNSGGETLTKGWRARCWACPAAWWWPRWCRVTPSSGHPRLGRPVLRVPVLRLLFHDGQL